MEYKHEITSEDDRFVRGRTYIRDRDDQPWQFSTEFSRYKGDVWLALKPHEILARLGVATDPRRAREFCDLLDGDLAGFDYLAMATIGFGNGEEALKWIMGPIAAALNERGWPFSRVTEVLPADHLGVFCEALISGSFEKSFAKDVFTALMAAPRYADDVRVSGGEVVARLCEDPRFQAAGGDEIDAIIESVVAANPDNAAKVVDQPKLVQWFVGQTMKAAKGKAPAPVVLEKLKARFGVE